MQRPAVTSTAAAPESRSRAWLPTSSFVVLVIAFVAILVIAVLAYRSLEARAEAADALVLVASNVSHSAAAKVRLVARRRGTPLASAMGPSVSRVRASIASAFIAARALEDARDDVAVTRGRPLRTGT